MQLGEALNRIYAIDAALIHAEAATSATQSGLGFRGEVCKKASQTYLKFRNDKRSEKHVSHKACPEQRRSGAKGAKFGKIINALFARLASWRGRIS
jgi:hypothetical protein